MDRSGKTATGPRVTLTLVSGCVSKIPEIRVLQKVDGAEFAVAQIVFVRGSNENVFEQQVGPSKIEASQPSKHTPKERGPTFSAAVSQFEPTPLRCLRFSIGLDPLASRPIERAHPNRRFTAAQRARRTLRALARLQTAACRPRPPSQ